MRRPYMTGSKPDDEPNEPKMYPGDDKFRNPNGGSMKNNLERVAEDAAIKPPGQLEHIAHAIDSEHIFGSKAVDKKPMHADPKSVEAHQMSGFGNQEKVKVPKGAKLKTRLPK